MYKQLRIVQHVYGLVLKDSDKVDQKALDDNESVKGTFEANDQFQIIIGAGDVNNVYDEFVKITG